MIAKKNISQQKDGQFFALELLTITYSLFTTIIVVFLWQQLDNPLLLLCVRVVTITAILLLYIGAYLSHFVKFTSIIRIAFPLIMLSYWYSETYEFNRFLPNLDYLFATIEQNLFGFQPALVFAKYFSSRWLSEAFNLGYFFYFPMMVTVILYCFFYQRTKFDRFGFIFLGSFFLYYLIFIFLPVAGPQFYFHAVGIENIKRGIFPDIGNYFCHNSHLLPAPGYSGGLFYRLVEMSQALGERPTAAFPSSHVGISTILMIWLYANDKKRMLLLLPFYLLLCGATVYIQAHYLIDVFAGWITAFVFYFTLNYLFNKKQFKPKMPFPTLRYPTFAR